MLSEASPAMVTQAPGMPLADVDDNDKTLINSPSSSRTPSTTATPGDDFDIFDLLEGMAEKDEGDESDPDYMLEAAVPEKLSCIVEEGPRGTRPSGSCAGGSGPGVSIASSSWTLGDSVFGRFFQQCKEGLFGPSSSRKVLLQEERQARERVPEGEPLHRELEESRSKESAVRDNAQADEEQADVIIPQMDLAEMTARLLPKHYNFEIPKVLERIRKGKYAHVGLQLPDGLIAWAPAIAQILRSFHRPSNSSSGTTSGTTSQILTVSILGDVNFGACCVDDLTARALGVELLVHFGHSCLVPVSQSAVKTMYVHVEVEANVGHLVDTVKANFFDDESRDKGHARPADHEREGTIASPGELPLDLQQHVEYPNPFGRSRLGNRVALLGTVQFATVLQQAKQDLEKSIPGLKLYSNTQVKPLGKTEVLGCTAPRMQEVDEVIFVCDGRFHLEAVMIGNPQARFFLYNPYAKTLTREAYDYNHMLQLRREAVTEVERKLFPNMSNYPLPRSSKPASSSTQRSPVSSKETTPRSITVGIILGTLGRQGSVAVLERLNQLFRDYSNIVDDRDPKQGRDNHHHHRDQTSVVNKVEPIVFLLSEISPDALRSYEKDIDFWVQIACPRLSLDWGPAFTRPCLTTYECYLLLERATQMRILLKSRRSRKELQEGEEQHGVLQQIKPENFSTTLRSTIETKQVLLDRWKENWQIEETSCGSGGCGGDATGGGGCGSGGCGSSSSSSFMPSAADYWPEVDYYSNLGGPWANYGGKPGTGVGGVKDV
ncbi:unnamed protein product [Amoebophrya sp. A25]|nr:unnamed protein product [Amoebophrya sp. A25]|eukprot:GSA25T00001384001.1